jgi:PAS domain S-box-containing protein
VTRTEARHRAPTAVRRADSDRPDELARLRRALRRATESSERETDAFFAQYQLSQLLAWGTTPAELAGSVLTELATLCRAADGVCWLAELRGQDLYLMARLGPLAQDPPACGDAREIGDWLRGSGAWLVVHLEDKDGLAGIIALRSAAGRPLDADGVRVATHTRHEIALAFRNVQLRSTLEEERRAATALIESATDAIVEISLDGHVRRTNPSARQLFGRSSEEANRLTCAELLGCKQLNLHREGSCPVLQAGQRGKPIEYLETTVIAADGQPVRVAGSVSPILSSAATVSSLTVILHDVEAQVALGELRESFVATVSHELRTPLALIRGYAESLRLLQLEDDQRRVFAEGIELQADRISTLLRGILDISHLDADPMALATATVTVGNLVHQLRSMLQVENLDDRLRVDIPFDLPPVVADPLRIGQVLRNLVENAVKYGPPGGRIEIGARAVGERVNMYVDDEGPGVAEGDRRLVTEPFHRGRHQRESTVPGYGLGLYIAKRLVEAHGGQLLLDDRPDGHSGTRATFSLPIAVGAASAGDAEVGA